MNMKTVDEGRKITSEIATMLNGMTTEQKRRTLDMIAVASILSVPEKPEDSEPQRIA